MVAEAIASTARADKRPTHLLERRDQGLHHALVLGLAHVLPLILLIPESQRRTCSEVHVLHRTVKFASAQKQRPLCVPSLEETEHEDHGNEQNDGNCNDRSEQRLPKKQRNRIVSTSSAERRRSPEKG